MAARRPTREAASAQRGEAERSSANSGGFTLLEVLGAVLIIGIAFTMLAGANIEGLRAEGVARRELGASLVADQVLADFEAGLENGTAIPPGTQKSERDGYHVSIEVTPLQLALPALPPEAPSDFADPASGSGPTLLSAPGSKQPTPLRHVRIRVSWDDGAGERSVERETFAMDATQAEPLLASLDQAQPGNALQPGNTRQSGNALQPGATPARTTAPGVSVTQ